MASELQCLKTGIKWSGCSALWPSQDICDIIHGGGAVWQKALCSAAKCWQPGQQDGWTNLLAWLDEHIPDTLHLLLLLKLWWFLFAVNGFNTLPTITFIFLVYSNLSNEISKLIVKAALGLWLVHPLLTNPGKPEGWATEVGSEFCTTGPETLQSKEEIH